MAGGGALVMWSGEFYVAMPWYPLAVLGFSCIGAVLGLVVSSAVAGRSAGWRTLAVVVPVMIGSGLAFVGAPQDTDLAAPGQVAVASYRGGCLAATAYTARGATMSLEGNTVTLHGGDNDLLRFRWTGRTWPSRDRAEILGIGVEPLNTSTVTALRALGCD